MLQMTNHAKERWNERFKNLTAEHEFSLTRKPTKVEISNISKQCPEHVSIMKNKNTYGLFYRISPKNIVFVCNREGVIITVFPYRLLGDKNMDLSRKIYRKGKPMYKTNIKNRW